MEKQSPCRPTFVRTDEQCAQWPVAPLAAYLAERELLLPAHLLGRGHHPLAFFLVHGGRLFAPTLDLLGLTPGQGWTAWLTQVTALICRFDTTPDQPQAGAVDGAA